MSLGTVIRRLSGPLEAPLSDRYRAFFVDLGRQAQQVRQWVPSAEDVLEIGCGEGAVCERLAVEFPNARLTGIDITPRVGRLFRGDASRVRFERSTAAALAAERPAAFDLVLACDVLHHVPWEQHQGLLREAARLLRPGGAVVVKDWELIPNLGHWLCELSDRVLTGDHVKYGSAEYFRGLLESVFGPGSVREQARVPPWRNNLLLLVRPQP